MTAGGGPLRFRSVVREEARDQPILRFRRFAVLKELENLSFPCWRGAAAQPKSRFCSSSWRVPHRFWYAAAAALSLHVAHSAASRNLGRYWQ